MKITMNIRAVNKLLIVGIVLLGVGLIAAMVSLVRYQYEPRPIRETHLPKGPSLQIAPNSKPRSGLGTYRAMSDATKAFVLFRIKPVDREPDRPNFTLVKLISAEELGEGTGNWEAILSLYDLKIRGLNKFRERLYKVGDSFQLPLAPKAGKPRIRRGPAVTITIRRIAAGAITFTFGNQQTFTLKKK